MERYVRHQTPPAGRHVFDWLNSLDMYCHVQWKMVVYVFAQSTIKKSYVFSYFSFFFEKKTWNKKTKKAVRWFLTFVRLSLAVSRRLGLLTHHFIRVLCCFCMTCLLCLLVLFGYFLCLLVLFDSLFMWGAQRWFSSNVGHLMFSQIFVLVCSRLRLRT